MVYNFIQACHEVVQMRKENFWDTISNLRLIQRTLIILRLFFFPPRCWCHFIKVIIFGRKVQKFTRLRVVTKYQVDLSLTRLQQGLQRWQPGGKKSWNEVYWGEILPAATCLLAAARPCSPSPSSKTILTLQCTVTIHRVWNSQWLGTYFASSWYKKNFETQDISSLFKFFSKLKDSISRVDLGAKSSTCATSCSLPSSPRALRRLASSSWTWIKLIIIKVLRVNLDQT